jgi:hypothetical protein
MESYNPKVTPWQIEEKNFPHDGNSKEKLNFLLRYAILAPSSHNTQPWKFAVDIDEIRVFTDKTRWLKVADADQRELYTSVGCALENLLIAMEHFGYGHEVEYFPDLDREEWVARVKWISQGKPSLFRGPELFDAITVRHTNHQFYEMRSVPQDYLQRIQDCCVEESISLYLTSSMTIKRKVDELIIRADATQFADPAFREELGYWIGQGVFGTPWLLAKLGQLAVSRVDIGKVVAKTDAEVLMSSPVLGLLNSKENTRTIQVKVGQVFERIHLIACALGLSLQPVSQLVQIPEIKAELPKIVPIGDAIPQQPFRLGFAKPEKGHTPRRPLEEVLI